MPPLPAPPAAAPPLRTHVPFRRFWLARVATTVAYQMVGVGVGWHVYELTGSALALGLIGLAQFLPALLLILPAGQIADRYDRRRVAAWAERVEAVAAALLALGSHGGWLTVGGIYALVLVIGAARAFETPSLQALLPRLVPADWLGRAVAGSASAIQTAVIAGPALAGLVYAAGPAVVFAGSAALWLLASVQLGRIATLARPLAAPPAPGLDTLFGGIAFIRSRPVVLGAISLDLFAVLLGGATALLPIYARDILASGPVGLGLLRSAPAVGALAMSLWLAQHPLERGVGRLMFASVAVFGVATLAFALSTHYALSLLALVVLGASDMISVVIRSSLVQLETPDEMRGRVSAVNSVFIGASNQLGEFESGLTAALFGTVPAAALGGLGTLAVVAIWMRLFPALARRERLYEPAAPCTDPVG